MSETYDVIVLGLGGMGSAACCHLAGRGAKVLGLEQFTPAHDRGSSHGHSRVIRQAYFEDPSYVPLLLRAYELWRKLEADTGEPLLTVTGGLMIGPPDSTLVTGSLRAAREHGLPHEMLSGAEVRRRFPPLTPMDDLVALYEGQAGYVRPEAAIRAHLSRAAASGAELHFEEPVTGWQATAGGVSVMTGRGTYQAGHLIVTAGAWAPQVLADLDLPLTVERQVLYWFAPRGGMVPFSLDRFPIYIWEMPNDVFFYGFPAQGADGDGVKVAFYRMGKPGTVNADTTPETVDRTVSELEVDRMCAALTTRVPALDAPLLSATVCLYTNTPDGHFVIAPHPEHSQVTVASPCSGHGYKFTPVIGEILADLALNGTTRHPIGLFDINRAALGRR